METWFAMRWERTAGATSAASPGQVWEVLLNGRHWADWYRGVEWMALEGPLTPGTVVTIKPHRAPQTAFRIESALPERLLELIVRFGPLAAMRLRWELVPENGGTSIVHTIATEGPVAGLLLRRAARRIADAVPANLERLAVRALQPS